MTTFLNDILFNNIKFDTFDTIILLNQYMYKKPIQSINISNNNLSDYNSTNQKTIITESTIKESTIKESVKQEPVINQQKNTNIIYPKCTDTLFWCLYIAKYGYNDYLNIGQKYKNKEIEIKQQMIEIIKKTPIQLKNGPHKITNVAIQEIMAELMIDKKTTFKTFYAMCLLNQLNMCIIDLSSNTYLSFITVKQNQEITNQPTYYIIYKSASGFFSIDIEEKSKDQYNKIISNMVELEHSERPIRSISSYKVIDLEIMAGQLNILLDDSKKYKKQEIYDKILLKCVWCK